MAGAMAKTFQLYQKAEVYHKNKKVDRDADAITYSRDFANFTFTPAILNKYQSVANLNNQKNNLKGSRISFSPEKTNQMNLEVQIGNDQ